MAPRRAQCPLCGGSLEHDEDCELRSLPIEYAARLGLAKALAKVRRQAQLKSDENDGGAT